VRLDLIAADIVGSLNLHSERARDGEGSSETVWCANYWWGECPGRGVVEGVRGGKKSPHAGRKTRKRLAEIHKNGVEIWQFPALIDLKITENTVFNSKVPNKIYSQDFF
jgi:hypothetical protein